MRVFLYLVALIVAWVLAIASVLPYGGRSGYVTIAVAMTWAFLIWLAVRTVLGVGRLLGLVPPKEVPPPDTVPMPPPETEIADAEKEPASASERRLRSVWTVLGIIFASVCFVMALIVLSHLRSDEEKLDPALKEKIQNIRNKNKNKNSW